VKKYQEPSGVTSQKTPFFIVTAVKTSNLTKSICVGRNRTENTCTNIGGTERATATAVAVDVAAVSVSASATSDWPSGNSLRMYAVQ
jgi:hypothetical protein